MQSSSNNFHMDVVGVKKGKYLLVMNTDKFSQHNYTERKWLKEVSHLNWLCFCWA